MESTETQAMMPVLEIEKSEFVDGLLYCHYQMNANASKLFEALAYSYSLMELLISKGIIGIEELDQRKETVAKRLAERFQQEQIGVRMHDDGADKYNLAEQEVVIDCESRWPICKAVCCRLQFPLSPQDVSEGIVRWNLGQPYMNRKGQTGHCVHLDLESCRCAVYEHRPAICRGYSCANDKRIWLDFEKRVINPAIFEDETASKGE
jgi:Fe-S-cluster containining protein